MLMAARAMKESMPVEGPASAVSKVPHCSTVVCPGAR
jgi:hypothetical protein